MDKLEKLQKEINSLRNILGRYLDNDEDFEKIFALNTQLDELIIEYHKLDKEIYFNL
ncbi:MAG: aspartyl-phosphate phosphatase Spo0E family protein [Clostridiales bacterium]|nr:aspartyl-phosphate phosphatase Spo0E family protein [Clostridiales bacterium]